MLLDPAYLSTAVRAALAAGRIHRRYFRKNPDVQKKGPIDLVTEADLAVEADFRRLIAGTWPDHAVLGEEGPRDNDSRGRCRWIIDPLDGTTNFAHGLALFCVSIALEVDGQVVLGVVYDPIADELFTAERGQGARLNGQPLPHVPAHARRLVVKHLGQYRLAGCDERQPDFSSLRHEVTFFTSRRTASITRSSVLAANGIGSALHRTDRPPS